MKAIKAILVTIIFIFSFGSCDRFEHSFKAKEYNLGLDEFSDSFKSMWNNLSSDNIIELERFVSSSFNHNNQNKEIFVNSFLNKLDNYENSYFVCDSVQIFDDLDIYWKLTHFSEENEIISETSFKNYLKKENDAYLLFGNQIQTQNVMIELFTADWCSFCPIAEEALHELKIEYSTRFNYIEYHSVDQLEVEGTSELRDYYMSNGSLPITAIQGSEVFDGASENEYYSNVKNMVENLLNNPPEIYFEGITSSLNDTIIHTEITLNSNLENQDNLYLKYAVIESFDEEHANNYTGENFRNVVLKHSRLSLSDENLDNSIQFEINLENLSDLPDDTKLVLWLQNLTEEYNENSCQILNSTEIEITQ